MNHDERTSSYIIGCLLVTLLLWVHKVAFNPFHASAPIYFIAFQKFVRKRLEED